MPSTHRTAPASRSSFWLTFGVFALLLASSGAPTPLYARYAAMWQLSAGALTVAFGVYAIALLVALLAFGDLSDAVGRRPVVLCALTILGASLIVFAIADGYVWLLVARILQGFAAGLLTASASAAMLDLEPSGRPGLASLSNVVGAMGGQAAGVLFSAVLVQYAPHPTALVFEALIAVAALMTLAYLWRVPETVRRRSRFTPSLRLGVPAGARPAFFAALPCLVATWALNSLYLSLGPNLVGDLVADDNRVVAVSPPVLLLLSGTVSALVLRGRSSRTRMLTGSGVLAAGALVTAVGLGLRDAPIFFVSVALAGCGFGVAFSGALQTLLSLATPEARGALVATVYSIAYLSFSVPTVVAGLVSSSVGLLGTSTVYSAVVSGLSLTSLIATRRVTRHDTDRPSTEKPAGVSTAPRVAACTAARP